ncbi:MAG: hypothetical protein A3F42_08040 [Gammaproteobacteria bacterium RIFCSPHIGHO2_12_FULL_37_34]|nr:MAG: hypothetical protein A3F42_08040 [Gammaproteobacteria bacterium RIFCSPHIGHO2_12_FULL_37_34]
MHTHKPTLFSFSKQTIKDHYRVGYQKTGWLQKEYNSDYIFVDLEKYYFNLRDQIAQLLIYKRFINQTIQLEELHDYVPEEFKQYGHDGISKIGTFFYETNAQFIKTLHEFIHHILYKKIIKLPFLFQATPTFRIHCPNSANAEFFPHFHTDLALGHPPYEINLWIPLTEKRSGHGFYLATVENSNKIARFIDYDIPSLMDDTVFRNQHYLAFCKPKLFEINVEKGWGLMFDGRCFHTAMPISDHTRISIDFRIVLQEDFVKAELIYENRGIRKQLLLLPNDYYYSLTSADL